MTSWYRGPRRFFLRRYVIGLLTPWLMWGCMRSPRVDAEKMVCTTDDNCLKGYVCSEGQCRKPNDGGLPPVNDANLSRLDGAADTATSGGDLEPAKPIQDAEAKDIATISPKDAVDAPITTDSPTRTGGISMATGGTLALTGGTISTGGTLVITGGTISTGGTTTLPPEKCTPLADPTNGAVSSTTTTPGGVATYSCGDGYRLQGSANRTCQAEGSWSGSAPSCAPVDCGPVPPLANGYFSALASTYSNIAEYRCAAAYTLVGSATRTCQANGTWSNTTPTCQCNARCGATCVDLTSDNNNCGVCGNVCAAPAPSVALGCNQICIIELVPAKDRTLAPSIAVDAIAVYWTDFAAGTVTKTPIGGGPSTIIASGQDRPRGIAVDATSIYWINNGTGDLMKLPLTGSDPTRLTSGQYTTGSIVVSDVTLYWPANGGIMTMAASGGSATVLVPGQNSPQRVAVDNGTLFWTDSGTQANQFRDGRIMKFALPSGPLTTLASDRPSPTGIAADATSVYWTELTANGSLMKVARTGGGAVPLATATGNNLPHQVTVDAANVYWTVSNAVNKIPIAGGETQLIGSYSNPGDIVVDSKGIYWSTTLSPSVMKATPK